MEFALEYPACLVAVEEAIDRQPGGVPIETHLDDQLLQGAEDAHETLLGATLVELAGDGITEERLAR